MSVTDAKSSRWSLSHNLSLLFKTLAKGWLFTLIVVVSISGLNAYYLAKDYGFTPSEIAIAIIGIIAALAFLKAIVLYMVYRFFNETAFEGSFFVTALLVSFLLIIALMAVSFLVSSRVNDFPTDELTWLLPSVFGIISVFLFITFRISHWVFRR